MLFSLIIATVNRSAELCTFLDSIAPQAGWIRDVIIVDQNDDDRLVGICGDYTPHLPIRHIRSPIRESSHARNLGLRLSLGDVATFPDDDCIYPPHLLERVAARFEDQPKLVLLSGPAMSPSGHFGSGRWNARSGPLTIDSVWTSVIEFNLFIRHAAAVGAGGFDEELGVGARFGSGEAADLAIRVMNSGCLTRYDTDIRVIHPDKRLTEGAAARAYAYGLGLGRVLRRHHPLSAKTCSFFIRPLVGMALGLISGQTLKRRYYWETVRGRWHGYIAPLTPTVDPLQVGPTSRNPMGGMQGSATKGTEALP